MNINSEIIRNDEKVIFSLRSLFKRYGFSHYKMSKFEEYDLYVKNKDFLVSDSVITFTDTNGKLLALKPDVTLSIIKNSSDINGVVQKLFYNENVYRVSKGTHSYKEIMQVGLEEIGDIDFFNICEVILMAIESLETISENHILDISNMDIITSLVGSMNLDSDAQEQLAKSIGEKNIHSIKKLCSENGVDENLLEMLVSFISLYGNIGETLPKLHEIDKENRFSAEIDEIENIFNVMKRYGCEKNINIDFSIFNDMKYYNGIVFRGFVEGVPASMLSGGQYDKLMKRMGRRSKAIGFAVYLDMIERLVNSENEYDVDTLLLYSQNSDSEKVMEKLRELSSKGESVLAQKAIPEKLRYKNIVKLGEVQ